MHSLDNPFDFPIGPSRSIIHLNWWSKINLFTDYSPIISIHSFDFTPFRLIHAVLRTDSTFSIYIIIFWFLSSLCLL